MNASAIIFYIISAFILVGGLLAVTSRKIFRSAIWLLFSLIGIAGLYFWMDMQFIAAVQVIVYVGGIVVLIIFSIFLTQQSGIEMPKPLRRRAISSLIAAVLGFFLAHFLIHHYSFTPSGNAPIEAGVVSIGSQLLSTTEHGYVLPFEVVSILLLAAMVGCIVIAMKAKTETK